MLFGANSKRVFIAKNCARTGGITAANLSTNLGQGEIVVTDEKGKLLNTAALAKAAKAIIIHMGIGDGKAISSGIIRGKQVKQYTGTKFIQQIEKKVYIGWNGTTGSIDLADANDYIVTLRHKSTSPAQMAHPFVAGANYTSKITGGLQYEVAKGIVDLLVRTYAQFDATLRINVVGDTTASGGVTGGAVYCGNNTISYTGGTPPVVGDKLVVPGLVDAVYGTELASVYEVLAIDSTNKVITIDREYQNQDQIGLAITIVSSATVYGIEIVGIRSSFRLGFGDLVMIDWDTTLVGFGDTLVTKTEGVHPNGRHEQVAMDELLFQELGRNYNNSYEFRTPRSNWIANDGYSAINISYESSEKINTLETNGSTKSLIIYLDRSTYVAIGVDGGGTAFGTNIQTSTGLDTVNADSLLNVLNAFMVGSGVIVTGANGTANAGGSLTAGTTFSTGIDV